mmetsp:Transcript_11455/g.11459  ORF Transcript_11455/g.11459 Transcript_11455/m.11459 type:complete len:87 (+) Transcript_11455:1254-1514(+)
MTNLKLQAELSNQRRYTQSKLKHLNNDRFVTMESDFIDVLRLNEVIERKDFPVQIAYYQNQTYKQPPLDPFKVKQFKIIVEENLVK